MYVTRDETIVAKNKTFEYSNRTHPIAGIDIQLRSPISIMAQVLASVF